MISFFLDDDNDGNDAEEDNKNDENDGGKRARWTGNKHLGRSFLPTKGITKREKR